MNSFPAAILAAFMLSGCAGSQPSTAADLTAAFDVASAAEAAYAAQPHANPKTVAELGRLLAAAQAALFSWTNSQSAGDQAALSATIAALVAYEASARAS